MDGVPEGGEGDAGAVVREVKDDLATGTQSFSATEVADLLAIIEAQRLLLLEVEPLVERMAQPKTTYGFGMPEDPRDFTPDPECSTEKERAAHTTAVALWEEAGGKPEGWDAPRGCEWLQGTDGAVRHVARAPWGLGTYTWRDEGMVDLHERIKAALEATK